MNLLYGTLTPAYGRDYKSGAEALKAWSDGKDFVINNPQSSTYCSVRDGEDLSAGSRLQLRYKKCTMVGVITKQKDGTWTGSFDGNPRH